MSITDFDTDVEAVALANDCDFGLGSNVFSGSQVCVRKHPTVCAGKHPTVEFWRLS